MDKAGERSSAIIINFAFVIRGGTLGIEMCVCGLTNFSRISLLVYRAFVVVVLIVHVVANSARTASVRARAYILLTYSGKKLGIR